MFEFSSKTVVNKDFRIKDILKMIDTDKGMKKALTKESTVIERIILTNVLSEKTLNMRCDEYCREIYIFRIELNDKEIPIEFIKTLDKSIGLHTYFIFQFKDEVKDLCIYRCTDDGKIIRKGVYESEWHREEIKTLPYCLSVKEIYSNLIYELVPLKPRNNEELNCFLERFKEVQKLRKQVNTLEKKAFRESQPRKKFEMGRELREKKELLEALQGDNNGQA